MIYFRIQLIFFFCNISVLVIFSLFVDDTVSLLLTDPCATYKDCSPWVEVAN